MPTGAEIEKSVFKYRLGAVIAAIIARSGVFVYRRRWEVVEGCGCVVQLQQHVVQR